MKKTKAAEALAKGTPCPEDMELINELARKELSPQEVYTFSVILCDNEVDRDFERFTAESLEKLGVLFKGVTGIFDHNWSAAGQKARIFKCQTEYLQGEYTLAGDGYCRLRGEAYILRTEGNSELISEIEGGIKKEVSVGCSVGETVCSICGNPYGSQHCGHVKGREYDGKLCFAELMEPGDAYEWSFVAVPAQKNAGVIKKFEEEKMERDMEILEKEAQLGRKYLAGLRSEVARLSGIVQPQLKNGIMESLVQRMEEEELLEFKKAFGEKLQEMLPGQVQLSRAREDDNNDDSGFII